MQRKYKDTKSWIYFDSLVIGAAIIWIALYLGIPIGLLYIVIHFVHKYW